MRLLILPLAMLAGCSCNQDYSFPKANDIVEDEPPENFGSWLSMDIAPDDERITMTYYDRVQGALGFAVGLVDGDHINWAHEQVDGYPGDDGLDRGDVGMYSSQRVAPDGTVWVAYKDARNGGLWVAHRLGPSNWETELVDLGSGMGNWASLDLDDSGLPIVAHHDSNSKTLRVCHYGTEAWTCQTAFEGEDRIEPGDTGQPIVYEADVGQYARLKVHNGVEHIAFYDAAQGSLNLLEGNDGTYVHTVIDDTGDVGQWPDIYGDGEDLYISYHDVGDQDLMLATRSGGSWSTQRIDDGDHVGADSELFKENGELAILYFDGFNNDMKVARSSGGSWSTSTLAGDGVALGFHNEVVIVRGQIWTASYNFTDNALFTQQLAAAN